MNVDRSTIDYAIQRNKVLTVTSYSYLGNEREYIDTVLERYLSEVGLNVLMNNISYCIHEVAGNAHKANLKRLYFDLKQLDIDNPVDYNSGMITFKQEALQHPEKYARHHKQNGYYIKFHFQIEEPYFKVVIRNNVCLTEQEQERINKKVEIARHAHNLADVYAVSEDYTEGAGLGIVMLHVILRNLGFDNTPFRIYTKGEETIAFLSLNIGSATKLEQNYAQLMLGN
ncbi:MAG: hypothetical protein K9L66_02460 [Spirochaetaceae bacterium]|nr:hypothetical protein [Spirochaetaceae bacterium]MCF7947690.1 hypothetical protein [Spirochaetia bacterium]MCF7950517.1 hypothetical protein [Spirochaetaceae bacterium]